MLVVSSCAGNQWLCWLSVAVLVVSGCNGYAGCHVSGCAGCQWLQWLFWWPVVAMVVLVVSVCAGSQ